MHKLYKERNETELVGIKLFFERFSILNHQCLNFDSWVHSVIEQNFVTITRIIVQKHSSIMGLLKFLNLVSGQERDISSLSNGNLR